MKTASSKSIRFTLVRHGESEANRDATVGGNAVPLTPEGRRQSALLGEYFTRKGHTFDAVWYSSLPRAIQTFEEMRAILPKDRIPKESLFEDARLIERQHGEWEGRSAKDAWTDSEKARMNQLGADYRTPGGESFRDTIRRMDSWLQDALKAARSLQKDRVHYLVVSHGHAIRCLVAPLFELGVHTHWRMALDNTSITTIRWVDGIGWFLDTWNATPHLDQP